MTSIDWSCPTKQTSRTDTVVGAYRELFGYALPPGAQYWTLGGESADAEGAPLRGSEVDQVTRLGLCRLDQFHSVEMYRRIHEANVAAWPGAHWYRGDFNHVLKAVASRPDFLPALVNFDTMWAPKKAAPRIAEAMATLGDARRRRQEEGPVPGLLYAVNVVMKDPYKGLTWTADEALAPLYDHRLFLRELESSPWSMARACYRYGRSRSEMGTFLFYLPAEG